jgi:hypothetical protein
MLNKSKIAKCKAHKATINLHSVSEDKQQICTAIEREQTSYTQNTLNSLTVCKERA